MLSIVEKILFASATVVSLYYTYYGVRRIIRIIGSWRARGSLLYVL